MRPLAALVLVTLCACASPADPPATADADLAAAPTATFDLEAAVAEARRGADSVEEALRPVSLLTPGQIRQLQQYRNAAQLRVAEQQGVPQPVDAGARQAFLSDRRLVELDDSAFWVVRELDYSSALVTPATHKLLTEIGRRFHARLDELGVPPMRFEITSALRTADDQERLRRVNPNAARGRSTHQYGTTVDITYASFRAPERLGRVEEGEEALARMALDLVGGRMALELKAELGHVLLGLQEEGQVMVTYERRQPVFHLTARG
jgi:hypothetical protein